MDDLTVSELRNEIRHIKGRRDFYMRETTRLRHELAVMKQTYNQLFQHHKELMDEAASLRGMRTTLIEERMEVMPKEEPLDESSKMPGV